SQYLIVGVLLAIWGAVMMIVVPVSKQVWFLFTNPILRERRRRAVGISGLTVAAVVIALLFIPVPYSTIAVGVVWIPGNAVVHSGTEGTVVRLLRAAHSDVATGDEIVEMEDPLLDARAQLQAAKTQGLRLRYIAANVKNPAEAQIAAEELRHAEADLNL